MSIAKRTAFVLLFLMVSGAVTITRADSIEITSGSVSPRGFYPSFSPSGTSPKIMDFRFAGDNISGSGGNGGQPPLGFISTCIINCVEGSAISPVAFISTGTDAFSGRVTYLGNDYEVRQANFDFTGNSSALPLLLPPDPILSINRISLPFTMNGTLNLRSLSMDVPDEMLSIFAFGNVNFSYVLSNAQSDIDSTGTSPGTAFLGRAQYVFGDAPTPEPVPEPVTILLFGTGLAGIAGYVKRERKKKKEKKER